MRLLTPGPASSLPQVLSAMSKELIHHRTDQFRTLYQKCVEGLRTVFQTATGEVAILSGSGTTGLEAAIINAFEPADKILIINSGYFGERLVNIAKIQKLNIIEYQTDWQSTYNINEVIQIMEDNNDLKGILMVYSETSTGALHDIQAIGNLVSSTDILLMVDAISGVVMNPFHFDDWHVDIAVAASQKGFFLSPGLTFVALSEKALKRARTNQIRSYYLNLLVLIDKFHDNQKIGTTPNIAMLQGLAKALEILQTQPMEDWNGYYEQLHNLLGSRLLALGFGPYANTALSKSLYVCQLPEPNAFAIRNFLYDETDILIEVGLSTQSDEILRIGCMNGITLFDVLDVCRGLQMWVMKNDETRSAEDRVQDL